MNCSSIHTSEFRMNENLSFFHVPPPPEKYPHSAKLNILHFHPLEVVGRGSETQLQVGENH